MDKVKYGIIGVGNMGAAHVEYIGQLTNCTVTAICDINPEKLKKYKEKKIPCFTSSDKFFAKADIDAVIIAVPHYDHVPLALKAISLGKHVIVEKPVAVQKSEAQKLVAAIKAHPELKVAAMFCQRTIDAHKKIKSMIDKGEIGQIRRINWIVTNWFRTQAYYDSGDWRASWRGEGGGVLLNQCPHQLDLMQWFFGMPESITAFMTFGKYHNIEVEDDVTAFLQYPDGKTGVFVTSTGEYPGTNRLEIIGERGRVVFEAGKIHFDRNTQETTDFSHTTKTAWSVPDVWDVSVPGVYDFSHMHRDIIENHANAILKGDALIANAAEGINGLELGNAMLLSKLTGKTVKLPINEKLFDKHLNELISKSTYVKKSVDPKAESSLGNSFQS